MTRFHSAEARILWLLHSTSLLQRLEVARKAAQCAASMLILMISGHMYSDSRAAQIHDGQCWSLRMTLESKGKTKRLGKNCQPESGSRQTRISTSHLARLENRCLTPGHRRWDGITRCRCRSDIFCLTSGSFRLEADLPRARASVGSSQVELGSWVTSLGCAVRGNLTRDYHGPKQRLKQLPFWIFGSLGTGARCDLRGTW